MKVKMNESIQLVILSTRAFFKAMYYDMLLKNGGYSGRRMRDVYDKTREYFNSIPLPDGMKHCDACFEEVMHYPIDKTVSVETEDLDKFEFGY